MENARGLGRHLAIRLAAPGESVVDVPPKLSARVRVLSTSNARKNDGLDALATALAASGELSDEELEAVAAGAAVWSGRRLLNQQSLILASSLSRVSFFWMH